MNKVLNRKRCEDAINDTFGFLNIGAGYAKMLCQLSEMENLFKEFIEYLYIDDETDEKMQSDELQNDFQSLRDRCVLRVIERSMHDNDVDADSKTKESIRNQIKSKN